MRCERCNIEYRDTHYHCCVCHRVFGSSSAYEKHQKATEKRRHPATDAALGKVGLTKTVEGIWRGVGGYSKVGTRLGINGGRKGSAA